MRPLKNKVEHRTEQGHRYMMGLAERVALEGSRHDDAELPARLRKLADKAVTESRTNDAIALQRAALLLERLESGKQG